ncbi:homeobox protein Hox-B6-like [Lissotriton helveticus]
MSAFFVNSAFSVSLPAPAGQEAFLGQIPVYSSSGYGDPHRHFPATYGAAGVQEKGFTAPAYYHQTASAAYRQPASTGRPASTGTRSPAAQPGRAPAALQDCAQGKSLFGEPEEDKCPTPVYPWMQRMNSCNKSEKPRPLTAGKRSHASLSCGETLFIATGSHQGNGNSS